MHINARLPCSATYKLLKIYYLESGKKIKKKKDLKNLETLVSSTIDRLQIRRDAFMEEYSS